MHVLKQPHRAILPQRRTSFVPVHRTLSALGAVKGLVVFWVTELKRDPLAPVLCFLKRIFQQYGLLSSAPHSDDR
jgi:hypothetical protein